MALCDFVTILFPAPGLIYMFTLQNHDRPLGPVSFCYIYYFLNETLPSLFHTASIWLTVALAFQRWVASSHAVSLKPQNIEFSCQQVHLRMPRASRENISDDAQSAPQHFLHFHRCSHSPKHSLLWHVSTRLEYVLDDAAFWEEMSPCHSKCRERLSLFCIFGLGSGEKIY